MTVPTTEKVDAIAAETKMVLKDAGLFRQQCYINGEWLDADSKVP